MEFRARRYGVLPEPGGLRDQLAGEMDRMSAARNVYDAFRSFKQATNWARWAGDNPGAWRIWQLVTKMRTDGAE